jgi:NitT/TauT family transport system permease protein
MRRALRLLRNLRNPRLWQGAFSLIALFGLWQAAGALHVGGLGDIPTPVEVGRAFVVAAGTSRYWLSWAVSGERVAYGFLAGTLIGVPFALALGMNKTLRGIVFPVVEMLRPVPPLAWVPLSILFWPTIEMSIAFVIFLGAFFSVVLNVLGGVAAIDPSLLRAALSMGARPRHIFWRIVLPATIPAIVTGMALGMGLTWEIVIAAEMIAGKAGLGYLAWEGFVNGSLVSILVAMVSIGVAGFLSCGLIWLVGRRATPWLKTMA